MSDLVSRRPRVDVGEGSVWVDFTTQDRRGSAWNLCLNDPDTEVYFGPLHLSIELRDLRFGVVLDPSGCEEDWKVAGAARAEALRALGAALTQDLLQDLFRALRAQGENVGRAKAQAAMRAALGLEDLGSEEEW